MVQFSDMYWCDLVCLCVPKRGVSSRTPLTDYFMCSGVCFIYLSGVCYFQHKTIYSKYENIWCACYNFRANLTTFHQPTNSNNPMISRNLFTTKTWRSVSPVPMWPKATAMSRHPRTTKTPSNASYCARQRITQFHLSLQPKIWEWYCWWTKSCTSWSVHFTPSFTRFSTSKRWLGMGFLRLTFLKLHCWDETSKTKPKKNTFLSDPFSPSTKVLKPRLLCQCSCLALPIPARWRGKCRFFLGGNWNWQTIDAGKII